MTPEQWNDCRDPGLMLQVLRGFEQSRKLRLFVAACFRHIWHLLPDARTRNAIEMVERLNGEGWWMPEIKWETEEAVSVVDSLAARVAARGVADFVVHSSKPPHHMPSHACLQERDQLFAAFPRASAQAAVKAVSLASSGIHWQAVEREQLFQSDVLRDIFGNPLGGIAISPEWLAWNDGTVLKLAQAAYEDRMQDGRLSKGHLAILADALEEAGCDNTAILLHLRSDREHWRGCQILDAILGNLDSFCLK